MSCRDLLGASSPLAGKLPGFAPREPQIQLAEKIELAIQQGQPLVAEAGTGIGKTLAYLAPALASGQKVIFSTGTKTLQDQLYFRDLPMVRQALGFSGVAALLKGRANYLCLYRMHQARESGRLPSREAVTQLESLNRWSGETDGGDLSMLDWLPDDSPLWPLVTSTADNCLGNDCPLYQDCFVVKARRSALDADWVVVNHHLLFADMALKQEGFGEILPGADMVIIDEAHLVAEIATRFFSQNYSSRQVQELIRDTLAESGKISGGTAALKGALEDCRQALQVLTATAHERLPQRGNWAHIKVNRSVHQALQQLATALSALAEDLQQLQGGSSGLDACGSRVQALLGCWRQITESGEDPQQLTQVVWFERRGRSLILHLTPLQVAEPLSAYRESYQANWIFTSATLTVGDSFEHFTAALGLDDAATYKASNTFDYRKNALIWLPQLPHPREQDYTEKLLQQVMPLIEANQGRAFLLFTSHRALQRAAEWLRTHSRFPLFVQGEGSRTRLLMEFRESGNGILLGAASFWEGVDVIGSSLSLVVIDKLPFAAPDDPVLEARIRSLRSQGGNPFRALQLPQAVIALKQGAGRLIRDSNDQGVLVLGDPRLSSQSYGRIFMHSLPPMAQTRQQDEAIAFLRSMADEATPA